MTPKQAVLEMPKKLQIEGEKDTNLGATSLSLKLSFGSFGDSKKLSSDKITVDADKKLIRSQKILLDSKELRAINNANAALRTKIKETLCLPFPDRSIFLIPFELVEEAEAICKNHQDKVLPELVEKFVDAFPALTQRAKVRLRTNWVAKDYEYTKEELRQEFTFEYRLFYFGPPAVLKTISPSIFKSETEKIKKSLDIAVEETVTMMRTKYFELIQHLGESLKFTEDGKQRKLYQSQLDKFVEFFRTFDIKNVGNDEDLKKEVERGKKLLSGVSIEALRTTQTLRDKVEEEMEKIKANMTPLIEVRGRKFRD